MTQRREGRVSGESLSEEPVKDLFSSAADSSEAGVLKLRRSIASVPVEFFGIPGVDRGISTRVLSV